MTGKELTRIIKREGVPRQTIAELIGVESKKTIYCLERAEEIPPHYEELIRQALRLPAPGRYKGARTSSGVRF